MTAAILYTNNLTRRFGSLANTVSAYGLGHDFIILFIFLVVLVGFGGLLYPRVVQ